MTRPISGALAAHLAGIQAFPVDCLMIQRRDGTRFGFTTLDGARSFDLGLGDEDYSSGMLVTAATFAAGLDASSAEFRGPLGPTITRGDLLGGVWDDAEAWFFRGSPVASGMAAMLHGHIREAREEGEEFVLQLRGETDAFNPAIGELITPYCSADFGDARCGVTRTPLAATVTAVTDALRFTVSFTGSYADGYFELGTANFLTGALAGDTPIEVFGWAATGAVVLFEPLSGRPQVGDTLELRLGCAKTREACMAYANILNFRGYPEVTGSDQILKFQVPDDPGA